MESHFQIDILAIESNAVKARLWLPEGSTAIVWLSLQEHQRLVATGAIRMFNAPDSANVLGASLCYKCKKVQ